MDKLLRGFYKLLLALACVSMVGTFVAIMLNIVARIAGWNIPGLDGYAGYSIAATLFLALPATLRHGDHIRASLVLERMGERSRNVLEYWCLGLGLVISLYLAWFACRLVWVSWSIHDVAATADATPMWIPQLTMALGCIGFAISFAHALVARIKGAPFFDSVDPEASHAE